MEDIERGEATTNSTDSSTGEPLAVRRRVDADGSFMGSSSRPTDSPIPEATDAGDTNCHADPLDVTVTLQQDSDNDDVSSDSSEFFKFFEEDTELSDDDTDDKGFRTSAALDVEGGTDDGQQKVEDISGTTETCNRSEEGGTSERDFRGSSEKEVSPRSDCDGDSFSDSEADVRNVSSPFGGSAMSLMELNVAFERATEALDQEKSKLDSVATVVGGHLTKVSNLTSMFYSVASIQFSEFVTYVASHCVGRSNMCSGGNSVSFEQRLDAVKAYVCGICNEAVKDEDSKPTVNPVQGKPTVPDMPGPSSSGEDNIMLATARKASFSYTVRKASNCARKSRNLVVRQRKTMSKLCAVAAQIVNKIKISHELIVTCLKASAIVLTPAVRACRLIEEAVRTLESEGRGLPELSETASATARCASEALDGAETVQSLHNEAIKALRAALFDLDVMVKHCLQGTDTSRDVVAAGDSLLELIGQPNASLAEIRNQEADIKVMRAWLTPNITEMKNYLSLIEQWSVICSDAVPVVLQALSSATQSTCNGIEASIKAVENILVPSGVSLTGST